MSTNLEHYARLAPLFEAPTPGFPDRIRGIAAELRGTYPSAADSIEKLASMFPEDPDVLAELYLRTFDIQAITTLDLGYVLFGEDYKRGALLAGLSGEHKKASNDCGLELADHLPNVLRLIPKMEAGEVRDELVSVILGPAVREMMREFVPERIAKKEEIYKKHHKTIIEHAESELRSAYHHAFEALYDMLKADFNLKVSLPMEREDTFERSLDTEMDIESSGICATGA